MINVICEILGVNIELPGWGDVPAGKETASDVAQYGAEIHRRIYAAAGERWPEVAILAAVVVKDKCSNFNGARFRVRRDPGPKSIP